MARNGTEQVRQLQRTLYRTAKQSKAVKFYSRYDKVWRIDVLWEAWKQVKENQGAPGVDGETINGIVSRGEEGLMLSRLLRRASQPSNRLSRFLAGRSAVFVDGTTPHNHDVFLEPKHIDRTSVDGGGESGSPGNDGASATALWAFQGYRPAG